MRKLKKTVSILLAVIMVFSIFTVVPVTVSAETLSGVCGENLTWEYDENTETLTISGSGKMYDYNNSVNAPDSSPWNTNNFIYPISSIVIDYGVTTVGDNAFDSIYYSPVYMKLSVSLPESLISIGEYAFSNSCFESISLPKSLISIGEYAFNNSRFESISLPESLISIGENAFRDCKYLTNIEFNGGVTNIGEYAFKSCENLESIELPEGLTSISRCMFDSCLSLRNVNIPESVTSIDTFAFRNCKSLKNITIPEKAVTTSVTSSIFIGCDSLETITFEGKTRNFYVREFLYLSSNVTVYLPKFSTCTTGVENADDEESTALGKRILLDADNASLVFGEANVVFSDEDVLPDFFVGHSISLNGDIAVNYYLDVLYGTRLHFEWYNKTYDHTITAYDFDPASRCYKVPLNVAAAEMNCPITATFSYEGEVITDIFSVREYADEILDSESEFSVGYVAENGARMYGLLADLVKKMLDYGAKAQTRFGVTGYELANTGVDYTMQPITTYHIKSQMTDMQKELYKYGINYIGTSVLFLSGTTLRHNYVITDSKLLGQVKDSANFDYVDKGARVCFELKDIPAAQLDVPFVFTLGDTTYSYSVMDYCKLVLEDENQTQANTDLAMATYWYNDAAKAYFYAADEYEDDII